MKIFFILLMVFTLPFIGMSQITTESCDFVIPSMFVTKTDEDGVRRAVLRIEFPCVTEYVSIQIYNRWGKVVLEKDDFIDGTVFELDGTTLKNQNYVYELNVKREGEEIVHTGIVAKH
jgi:hypothetical protein